MLNQWALNRRANLTSENFRNPIFEADKYDPHTHIPTGIEGTTELVGGTTENPKVLKLAGGDPY